MEDNKIQKLAVLDTDEGYKETKSDYAVQHNDKGHIKPLKIIKETTPEEIAKEYYAEHPEEIPQPVVSEPVQQNEPLDLKDVATDILDTLWQDLGVPFAQAVLRKGCEIAKDKVTSKYREIKRDLNTTPKAVRIKNQAKQTKAKSTVTQSEKEQSNAQSIVEMKHISTEEVLVSEQTHRAMESDIAKQAKELADKIIFYRKCVVDPNMSDSDKVISEKCLNEISLNQVRVVLKDPSLLDLKKEQLDALNWLDARTKEEEKEYVQ